MTTPTTPGGTTRPGNGPLRAATVLLAIAAAAFLVRANQANPRAVWYCTVGNPALGAPQDSALMDTTTMTPLVVLDRATGAPRLTRTVDATFPVDSVAIVTISAPCASLAPDTTTSH